MTKLFIVRSTSGEMSATALAERKVIFAFEERALADRYLAQLNAQGGTHKIESIEEEEFHDFIIPVLRTAQVSAVIFNYLPGEPPAEDAFSVDITGSNIPRTYDFKLNRWLTPKEARRLRRTKA